MNIRRTLFFLFLVAASSAFSQSLLEKGKELLNKKMFREAAGLLRQAVDSSPKNLDAWRMLGEAYLGLNKIDSAEIAARRAMSINDERPEPYILLSNVFVSRKNYPEATRTLRSAIRAKVSPSELLTHLGYVLLQQDSLDQAIVSFSQAIEANPNNSFAYEGLGDAYMKQGVPVIAILQGYEKSVEVDSTRAEVHDKLGNAYYKERDYTKAARSYEKVLRIDSTNANTQLKLGKLYFAAKLYFDAARVLKAYVKNPSANGEALLMYMDALYFSRQHEDALAMAEKILKTDPKSTRALRVAANSYAELKKHDNAIATFEKLGKLDTLRFEDYRHLARSYVETKRDSLAVQILERAIVLDTTEVELYSELGSTLMRMRKYDRAAAAFEKRFQKETVPTRAASAYLNYGICMMALEKWEPARWALRTALNIVPTYVPGYTRLGLCLSQLDSLDEAKKVYQTVLAITDTVEDKTRYKSETTESHQQIGFINLRLKKYPDAIESLTRADKMKQNDVQTILWLAQTYHLMNKSEEACREYKRVLKLDSKNEAAKKGVDLLLCE
jgi:tetratricopeptide (TPR) repeat protein